MAKVPSHLSSDIVTRCETARAEGKHPLLLILTPLDYEKIMSASPVRESPRWYVTSGGRTIKQYSPLVGLPVMLSRTIRNGTFILICREDVPK